jgi:multimeric flavodoxin WrbA
MKVLAINSSVQMGKGNTAQILNPFIEGMKEAGAEVSIHYTQRLNIKPCTGIFQCWYKTPGKCYINDDMQMLYPKLREADIWVFAIPVYLEMPSKMQIFLNRLMPIGGETVVIRDGRMFPTLRKDVALTKIILVSSCGFWGTDNFSVLLHFMERLAKTLNVEFIAALLRPHGFIMKEKQDEQTTKEILEAAKQAGYQLIQEGQIKQETLETIKQPLTSLKELHKRYRKAHEKAHNLSSQQT